MRLERRTILENQLHQTNPGKELLSFNTVIFSNFNIKLQQNGNKSKNCSERIFLFDKVA